MSTKKKKAVSKGSTRRRLVRGKDWDIWVVKDNGGFYTAVYSWNQVRPRWTPDNAKWVRVKFVEVK